MKAFKIFILAVACCFFSPMVANWGSTSYAAERIILVGPKTIGPGWKDKIVLEPRLFSEAEMGDVLTVYTDGYKRSSQGTFQNPSTWQAIAEQYKYFGVAGPFRMTITTEMLPSLQKLGVAISGKDYRIRYVTLSKASDYKETMIWKGPAVRMDANWGGCAEIKGKLLASLKIGDALRLHISKTKSGSAVKIMDLTWNPIDQTVDGAPVGGDAFTYYIDDQTPLIKLQLAGGGDNVAMRIGGKDYQLDGIGIVSFVGERSEDTTGAQRAPKEYKLQPGELFHGEQVFPNDWSGNLRITAAPFQHCTENDVLIINYILLPQQEGVKPCLSLRENHGKWLDLSGNAEPQWQELDGNDVVVTFDSASLDKVKTSGVVVTGRGFTLNKIELMKVE